MGCLEYSMFPEVDQQFQKSTVTDTIQAVKSNSSKANFQIGYCRLERDCVKEFQNRKSILKEDLKID